MNLLSTSSLSSVDRTSPRCSGGNIFDSCRGLKFSLSLITELKIHYRYSFRAFFSYRHQITSKVKKTSKNQESNKKQKISKRRSLMATTEGDKDRIQMTFHDVRCFIDNLWPRYFNSSDQLFSLLQYRWEKANYFGDRNSGLIYPMRQRARVENSTIYYRKK